MPKDEYAAEGDRLSPVPSDSCALRTPPPILCVPKTSSVPLDLDERIEAAGTFD